MSRINAKMGLRPAGQRAMMKLPKDKALRNRVTSAKCPACQQTGAHLSKATSDLICGWCGHRWALPPIVQP